MKIINLSLALVLLTAITALQSCKDGADDGTSAVSGLLLRFDHKAGSETLEFNQNYTIESGEIVQFSKIKYYISNIALQREDGSWYTVPQDESYFLLDHTVPNSLNINLPDVPAGQYTALRYVLGVDSARSVAPISQRTGVLDESGAGGDMYWSWNSGYIFIKMEGSTGQEPFQYHIGGFGGYNTQTVNNIKTITLALPEAARVVSGRPAAEIYLEMDALEFFKNPVTIVIADNPTEHFSAASTIFANNYADMFTVHHVHNP